MKAEDEYQVLIEEEAYLAVVLTEEWGYGVVKTDIVLWAVATNGR